MMIRIKEMRKAHGWTTKELGDRIGVSQAAVSNWENGLRSPKMSQLVKLSRILGCTPNDLLGFETEEKPAESVRDIVARRVEEVQRGAAL